jgi:tetratricopeptide (TPR) repeat protein
VRRLAFRRSRSLFPAARVLCLSLIFPFLFAVSSARAQNSPTDDQDRKTALALYQQNRFEDALPLFEQLTAAHPKDMILLEGLGTCLLAHAVSLSDPEMRRQTRLRAREAFLRAQKLGDNSNYLQTELQQIPEDGSVPAYSDRKEVDDAMRTAEAAFGRGDFPAALAGYAQVLRLDPQNYQAALFSGDVCFKHKDYAASYSWFEKAVAIDPDQEAAYRYWGDALYADGKNSEARQKFIAAVVANPYQRVSWVGLTQWAQRNGVTLSQPKIDSPNSVTANGNQANIMVDASTLGKKDGTESWMLYEITRLTWKNTEFQKTFPNEKQYRHSLAEESAALGMVADAVSENVASKKIRSQDLNPPIATLIKIKREGLLEAYILLVRPDEGLAQDYPAYRKDHRDKLLQYMNEYVVPQLN